ncbi:hypothetical protein F6R97_25585 [Pseudomonas sp. JV414]|nr:hypothetical protein [Pseudomonas sp. JV414]
MPAMAVCQTTFKPSDTLPSQASQLPHLIRFLQGEPVVVRYPVASLHHPTLQPSTAGSRRRSASSG